MAVKWIVGKVISICRRLVFGLFFDLRRRFCMALPAVQGDREGFPFAAAISAFTSRIISASFSSHSSRLWA